jgi:alcohol dehydrogenase (cytochrome c)
MGTIDGHMVAVDAKTGKLLWDRTVVRPEAGYAFASAPLVVKDKVIIGPAGGEYGIRGFLAAFDVATGNEVWRFNLVPGPGEPGFGTWQGDSWKTGGASIWLTGSYDPELNLTYWGVGNPGPDFNGDNRKGDNLYSNSVVALDPDTGKLKWHFQFTPHDEFDYDATQVPVLADIAWQGRMRKAMLFANRNGFTCSIAERGSFCRAAFGVNWASPRSKTGRLIASPARPERAAGNTDLPGTRATNWALPYTACTAVLTDGRTAALRGDVEHVEGRRFAGGGSRAPVPGIRTGQGGYSWAKPEEGYGAVRAIDPNTGALRWEFKMSDLTWAGVLTTASNVLFSGGGEGYFYALDARTGNLLWRTQLGSVIRSGPMSFAVNGKQHVAITAGSGLFVFKLRE